MNKQRNIQIEILRIIAMFMIVLGHAFTHGHATENVHGGGTLNYIAILIRTISIPGTNIFVLISGYFLIRSKPSIKRMITVWLQILFYSVTIFLIMSCLGLSKFTLISLVKYSMPVSFNQYWFMSVYFWLILCAPFLNILLNNLNKRGHQYLILLGIILMVIPASIPGISVFNREAGNGILWFFMLYSTGAYFSKYPPKFTAITYSIIALSMLFVAFASQIVLSYVSSLLGFHGMGVNRFSTFDSFPIYIEAVCILCAGINWRQKPSGSETIKKIVLFFSGSTAGVYMIHEHPLVRKVIWEKLNLASYPVSYAILASIILFIVCALIDKLTWKKVLLLVNHIDTRSIDDRILRGFSENGE